MESADQVFIGFKCDAAFREEIERAARKSSISQFIRESVIEKLQREGYRVADELAAAPSRLGKGGAKKGSCARES